MGLPDASYLSRIHHRFLDTGLDRVFSGEPAASGGVTPSVDTIAGPEAASSAPEPADADAVDAAESPASEVARLRGTFESGRTRPLVLPIGVPTHQLDRWMRATGPRPAAARGGAGAARGARGA